MLVKDFFSNFKTDFHKDVTDCLYNLHRQILLLEEALSSECELQYLGDPIYCEILEKYRSNINQMHMSIDPLISSIKNAVIQMDQHIDPELMWDTIKYYQNILIQRKILLLAMEKNCPKAIQKYKKLITEQSANEADEKNIGSDIYQELLLKNSKIIFK